MSKNKKKGTDLNKLIKEAKTPKGMALVATMGLVVIACAVAISSFAASKCGTDTDSGSATCKKGTYWQHKFSKSYCFSGSRVDKSGGGTLQASGTTVSYSGSSIPKSCFSKGTAKWTSNTASWKIKWGLK